MSTKHVEIGYIETKLRESFGDSLPTFKPIAYYDNCMDCIRVLIRDTSTTEKRINGLFTIIVDNYPNEGHLPYVGFSIKGVQHLCRKYRIPAQGPVKIAALLDAIVREAPELTVEVVVNCMAKQMLETNELDTVEISSLAYN